VIPCLIQRDLGSNTRRPTVTLWCGLTLLRTCAISKVPVVSMLAAMMGMPVYVCLELRNVKVLWRST